MLVFAIDMLKLLLELCDNIMERIPTSTFLLKSNILFVNQKQPLCRSCQNIPDSSHLLTNKAKTFKLSNSQVNFISLALKCFKFKSWTLQSVQHPHPHAIFVTPAYSYCCCFPLFVQGHLWRHKRKPGQSDGECNM